MGVKVWKTCTKCGKGYMGELSSTMCPGCMAKAALDFGKSVIGFIGKLFK